MTNFFKMFGILLGILLTFPLHFSAFGIDNANGNKNLVKHFVCGVTPSARQNVCVAKNESTRTFYLLLPTGQVLGKEDLFGRQFYSAIPSKRGTADVYTHYRVQRNEDLVPLQIKVFKMVVDKINPTKGTAAATLSYPKKGSTELETVTLDEVFLTNPTVLGEK